ncbi:unnamed protein product, partial [Meganyctiphanes norvegica]
EFMPPENCESTPSNPGLLDCNIRTFGSDWNISHFSSGHSEHIVSLNIACSDVLFFQSSLEPRSFQRLNHMLHLDIHFCKFTHLPDRTFLGLDNLESLVIRTHNGDWSAMSLELTSNSLVGITRLERLDLGVNNIWTLPKRILCPLPALQHLNLTTNRLQEVSVVGVVGSCGAHLVTLDLSFNDLVILPKTGLIGLRSLRELYIQYNKISRVEHGALMGLANLNVLNMSSNRILTLPPNVFNETTELRELYIQNNILNTVPPGLFAALTHLTALDMSHNHLTSAQITAVTFHRLFRLVVLNLNHNRLSHVNSDMFRDLSDLQVLDLSYNELTVVTDKAFKSLNNLHHLDISHNQLHSVGKHSLSGLHTLSALLLAHNNISSIALKAFENITSLKDLHIEYNALKDIPESFSELTSIRTLRVSQNIIRTIKSGDLTKLGSLVHLDISHNALKVICKKCLGNLYNLEVLDLASNDLSDIPQGSFDSNMALQILRLDGNKLSDINGLFASLSELIWLNISDNRITWFDYALIPVQLLHLDIHNNRIHDIGNYFNIESKLELRTLDVSHNQLDSLRPSSIPNSCELLFVNSNRITQIAPGAFSEKINISMVDLFDNLLSKIDLTSINLPLVSKNTNVPEFYIGGNPIFCDCHMEWMHRIHKISSLRQHPRIMDLDKITCTIPYPRSEDNRVPFLITDPTHFLCPYTSHCFSLCQCCDFIACDCQMTCPDGCSCYHDDTWSTNIVDCSTRHHHHIPDDIPMDATIVYMDGNQLPILSPHHFIGHVNMHSLYLNRSQVEIIQNRTFHGLSSLKKLHLEDNVIEYLEGFEFEHLYHLRELYLHNNNL